MADRPEKSEPDQLSPEERAKRESGQPGGGKGRKDEVGKSGVYPMSGPLPEGPAELRTPAAWGQGERGAAGYEDSGRSELVYEHGQLLGGLDTGAPGSPPEAGMEIQPEAWEKTLDAFSHEHKDCPVQIEEVTGAERRLAVNELPLEGISSDRLGMRDKIYVSVGDRPDDAYTHTINAPRRLRIVAEPDQPESAEIDSADGKRTIVRCLGVHRHAA